MSIQSRSSLLARGLLAFVLSWPVAAGAAQHEAREQDWTHSVRIAGHGLSLGTADSIVRSARETNVFGIETDNDIPGRYESFLNPEEKLKAIRAVAEKAHAAGNKAFVYIAGLECITANADASPHSFFKDHPDWVQRNAKGDPAVFGGGSAFWIRKGDEDVWISPYAPEWRRIYMGIVRRIAATGIDGIYVDIPYWMTHFEGWEDTWASFDGYTVAAFKAKSGLDARKDIRLGDFRDPGFRRWVGFRIESLTDFMREIDANAKAVNPRCMTIAEIYPGIEEPAVRVGADVYDMYRVVDVIAHEYEATAPPMAASKNPLDWFDYMIGMYCFRSFAGGKASWMLSYSWDGEKAVDPREAMKTLFAAQLMAGTNSWDARGHVMSGSNDLPTRAAVFGWIARHEKTFYRLRHPIRPVGVYFSPATRNYFSEEFMESYRGVMSLLLHSHREFRIVTPRDLRDFTGEVLILPDARCLSETELSALSSFQAAGGKLVVTGETGRYTESGEERNRSPIGEKARVYKPDCPGRAYFLQLKKEFNQAAAAGSARNAAFEQMRAAFDRELAGTLGYRPAVEVSASPFVAAQIARVGGKMHVFLANFKGLKGKETAVPSPEANVRIRFPSSAGSRIFALPYLGEVQELPAARESSGISCVIPEVQRGMVVWCE